MPKIIKSIEGTVKMPKKIVIGDPLYFEDCPDRTDLIYNKGFRGKNDWLGYIILSEEEDEFEVNGEIRKFSTYVYKVIFAPDLEKLETYKSGRFFKYQRDVDTTIGVDSAQYYIQIDSNSEIIRTGADGYWGIVTEFLNKSKLEGILIDLAFPDDLFSFDDCKKTLEYLFNFKF